MEVEDRKTILVLSKQFFVDTFLSERGTNVNDFIEQNHYLFIANLTVEMWASLPDNGPVATTTSKAMDDFRNLLIRKQLNLTLDEILRILKGPMYVIEDESINRLNDRESMIAIADRLYVSSNYDPIIVINPSTRENYKTAVKDYYKNNDPIRDSPPFKIYDPRKAKAFLEAKFPYESSQVIRRTKEQNQVFD
jgi:hypothetical protein